MELYFVRHGKTLENQKGLYYGMIDSGLLPESRKKLQSYSGWFLQQQFDAVYVSPMRRALETVEILLPGYTWMKDRRLEERHFGILEGKTYEEILRDHSREAKQWEEDWMNYEIPEGESFWQVQKRVSAFAEEIKESGYEKILIVSHKGTMIQLIRALLKIPPEQYWKFTLESDCYSTIRYSYGNAVLTTLNQRL